MNRADVKTNINIDKFNNNLDQLLAYIKLDSKLIEKYQQS